MKRLLIAMLFMLGALFAQSPFDGTWVINSDPVQLPEKPEVYVLSEGTFCCFLSVSKVKADGLDHKVVESAYTDTEMPVFRENPNYYSARCREWWQAERQAQQ
jgi:hypothetical protein